jgi:hypothetical protein
MLAMPSPSFAIRGARPASGGIPAIGEHTRRSHSSVSRLPRLGDDVDRRHERPSCGVIEDATWRGLPRHESKQAHHSLYGLALRKSKQAWSRPRPKIETRNWVFEPLVPPFSVYPAAMSQLWHGSYC